MINIHIVGDGKNLYAVKTLLEINAVQFDDEIQVTCFGDNYLNPAYVRKFTSTLTMHDIVRGADIVVCTNPNYEDDNIVGLCSEFGIPLLCTFALQDDVAPHNNIILDDINLQYAATDMWIKRIVNVNENVKSIKHFTGISKTSETGENALPGLSLEDYQEVMNNVLGQPKLIKLQNKYFFASEIDSWLGDDNIDIQTNWIADTDNVDASKVDWHTETLFHTTVTSSSEYQTEDLVKHSHLLIPGRRTLNSWHYANACVVASFVYMWHRGFLPENCTSYEQIDHSTFVDNIFGAMFKLA